LERAPAPESTTENGVKFMIGKRHVGILAQQQVEQNLTDEWSIAMIRAGGNPLSMNRSLLSTNRSRGRNLAEIHSTSA
jgi:hypothetical protein